MRKKNKFKKIIEKFRERNLEASIVSHAFFMILTLIISIFAFAFLTVMPSQLVEAQVSQACCEKLKDTSLYCQNAYPDSCDPDFKSAPTSCEATSFCKLGCCHDSVEGTCAENTPRKLCELRGGTWDSHADCKIAQCVEGCCVLGDEASLATLVRCKKLASYYGLEVDYRAGVTSESACIALAQAQDKGACVFEATPGEVTCKFTTRAECKKLTAEEAVFHKDFLCSAEELGTNCARQHHTSCVDGKDEVYWFDSCGNAENIYDSNKERSYNNGKVLSKEQSCGAGQASANNPTCGNCEYYLGSMCGKYRTEKGEPRPTYGEYICRDINCKNTFNGKDYKHGESWCVYDAEVGDGKDVVGSRHWRHLCVLGEEKVEPCDDYRQGTCIEEKVDIEGEEFNEAVCRANNWRACLDITSSSNCEKEIGCYWKGLWKEGVCLPDVPPGFKLNTREGGSVASSICSMVSLECAVVYEKKIFGEECIENCECLEESWTQDMLEACTSLGDCGAYVNIAGKVTRDGYSVSGPGADVSEAVLEKLKEIFGKEKGPFPLGRLIPTGRTITGMADKSSPAEGSGGKEGGAGDILGLGTLLNPVQKGISSLTLGPGGIFWNVGICATGAFFAGKMVAGMLGLSEESANIVGYAGAASAAISSFVTGTYGAGATIPAGTTLASGSVLGAGSTITSGTVTITSTAGTSAVTATAASPVVVAEGATATIGTSGATVGANAVVAEGATATAGIASTIGTVVIVALIVIAIAIILMKILKIGETRVEKVSFSCLPWQAPSGGEDCELCNKEPVGGEMKPCSPYRCSSLGVSCSLLNEGMGNETCAWLNPNDVSSPIIKPMEAVLTSGHAYEDVKPCPPGPGCWKIVRVGAKDGCIKAFTPLEFGIETNEPAQCKVDYEHTEKFDDMQFWFGGTNLYLYNRSMKMSLPGPDHLNAQIPELKNDGKYTLYARCRDGNGNANLGEMAIQFCVEPGPDTTPTKIERTSIDNGAPVAYGTTEAELDVYLNEPAECRWSFTDQDYENMNNSFDCATRIEQMEGDMTFKCTTTLTNIDDGVENTYYFRCKDQPWLSPSNESDRNVNKESYVFKLEGTQPLNISSVLPNGTVQWGSEPIPIYLKVETVNGYDYGEAKCYYSNIGYDNMILFFETDAAEHEQSLNLLEGDYTSYILCRDLAGNVDKIKIDFRAEVDRMPPVIVRVYQEAGMLKIITDEDSDCRYGIKECNFDFTTATEMPFDGTTEHTAEWRTDITYYIKCRDEFGNMPAPSDCSMQVNAYDVEPGP